MTATAVQLDLGIDHDAIERELDRQMGIEPKPRPERPWQCLAGEAPAVCSHARIDRAPNEGLADVVCLGCGHRWSEAW